MFLAAVEKTQRDQPSGRKAEREEKMENIFKYLFCQGHL